jgi:hypothetical protein
MQLYQQGMRNGRPADSNEPSAPLRSPLLEDFRANKTRKWELRVFIFPLAEVIPLMFNRPGYIRKHCGVQWGPARFTLYPTEA